MRQYGFSSRLSRYNLPACDLRVRSGGGHRAEQVVEADNVLAGPVFVLAEALQEQHRLVTTVKKAVAATVEESHARTVHAGPLHPSRAARADILYRQRSDGMALKSASQYGTAMSSGSTLASGTDKEVPDRHHVSRGFLEVALQAEPA